LRDGCAQVRGTISKVRPYRQISDFSHAASFAVRDVRIQRKTEEKKYFSAFMTLETDSRLRTAGFFVALTEST
jgi:hypothetical protein